MKQERDILALAEKHGIHLAPDSIALDSSGLDFFAAHAVDEAGVPWILRMPRRPDVVASAAVEGRVLAMLAGRLPVALPDWRVSTAELIAYPRLAGTPAGIINLEKGAYDWHIDPHALAPAFVRSTAAALAALHGIDPALATGADLAVRRPEEVRRAMGEMMDETRRLLRVPDAMWRHWQDWLADDGVWPAHTALIHGDMHPGHMLVDEDERVTGLLDWTEAQIGDPATDFIVYHAAFGAPALDALIAAYEEAGGRVWPRMAEHVAARWSASAVGYAMYARKTGDPAHLEGAQGTLDYQAAQLVSS